jgi:predicted Zn-dependent protease
MRGLAYDEKQQYGKAASDQRRAMRYFPGNLPLLAASLARSLALSGEEGDARRQLKEVNQLSKYSSLPYYHIAMSHALWEIRMLLSAIWLIPAMRMKCGSLLFKLIPK